MRYECRIRDARAISMGVFFFILLGGADVCRAQFPPQTSRPATRAVEKKPGEFQPGVSIDWDARAVRVRGRVAQTAGPLEFFACFAGKDHESAIRMEAEAEHVFMALGLCGNTPGAPIVWNENTSRYSMPTGDLIDVFVTWSAESDELRRAGAFDWLIDSATEQKPLARPWVFTGSIRAEGDSLAAGRTGAGVAIVDMPDSLLALTRSYASGDNDLWAVANSEAIPASGTPVTVEFRPAAPRSRDISLDFRGTIRIDGQIVSIADAVDAISLMLKLDQKATISVKTGDAMKADYARLEEALKSAGVPVERIQADASRAAEQPNGR
ncbi:MAG: hypothetical protein JNG88_10055 [Phycisphaerales bacterium]|nr:hypothetical protein [Phycisphaerales bacterium]